MTESSSETEGQFRNPSRDRQRFVDAVVLISAPDWSVKLSNFENLLEMPFEFGLRMLGFAKLKMFENYSLCRFGRGFVSFVQF